MKPPATEDNAQEHRDLLHSRRVPRNNRARNSLICRSLRALAEQLVEDRGVEPLASRMPF